MNSTSLARLSFVLLLLIYGIQAEAQQNPVARNNPLYWKNRPPDGAYWQQDVHYKIYAVIDEKEHRIDGKQVLDYYNNSPDTLRMVFFHLYQNAFVEGSYLSKLSKEKGIATTYGRHEAMGEGTIVSDVKANGITVPTELDNTILKVTLEKPLLPGEKVSLSMTFNTWWDNGSVRRRMKMYDAWGFMHYNGVQWFPKVCVYDRKFGWDTYQHLNKEFYGDFGIFEVSLDFPSNYVVEATGALENRKEVLPDALREKLDVKHFAKKPWDEAPSTITPYVKGERKVWKFKAENVHDFAFTADPSYRISTAYWKGIECVGIVQEPHASGWQNTGSYVAKIIQTFSTDFGMYAYPKMVAADAQDGMEYPMLTLDGGRSPSYNGLLVHEIGHNWFYGMVGSNETYRAAMDEGFTQFLTAYGLEKIDGNKTAFETNLLNTYTRDALNKDELPLATHSNDFHDALGHEGGYRQVYYKTGSMLYNLQYVLGDELFISAMQHYFNQWKIAHPYFEDFRASIINYTHVDLNWFFDQWIETTKTIDYSIGKISKGAGKDDFKIKLKRKGLMQMPIDFTVTAKNGDQHSFYIPNSWFEKKTKAKILPKWYGWSKIQPEYTAEVNIPSGIRKVQIDTTYRLADVYYPNNYKSKNLSPFEGVQANFDRGKNRYFNRRIYQLEYRPDVWWNPIDGVKAGFHVEGDYLSLMHRIDATVWFNTHLLQYDQYLTFSNEKYYKRYAPVHYSFSYASPLVHRVPKLELRINSRFLDGLWYHRGGLAMRADERNTIQLFAQTMYRPDTFAFDYPIYPQEWSSVKGRPNTSINVQWDRTQTTLLGSGILSVQLRAPLLTGNRTDAFNYAYVQVEANNYKRIDKLELRTRLFGRWGTGTNLPNESLLYAAGANPEQLMEDKYTRSIGIVPQADGWNNNSPFETGHFQQGGGMNLRGYAGYFIADERDGSTLLGYKARSGVAVNAELDFDQYIDFKPKLTRQWLHVDAYLFGDAGLQELSRYTNPDFVNIRPTTMWSDLRLDAGAGFAFTIKKWGKFSKAKPLTIRADFPVLLNRPPFANPQYGAFRYVLGIGRSF